MRRTLIVLVGLVLLLAALILARLSIGSSGVGWPSGPYATDILDARQHRLVLALVVGAALAVSGVALQALLRNPLAEPYVLGLSTGAAVGIMAQSLLVYTLYFSMAEASDVGQDTVVAAVAPAPTSKVDLPGWVGHHQIGALAGAMLSVLIVFMASRRRGVIDPVGLLLTGIVLSTINGAIVLMLNYLVGPGGLRDDLMHWMMGFLDEDVGRQTVAVVVALTVAGLFLLLFYAPEMNIATLSEGEALSLGVHLGRLRTLLLLVASVLAAGAVVLAGPIAFVGLICPHLTRLLLGPRHGTLLIGSAFVGASLIVLSDLASVLIDLRWKIGLMPIGIFTALVGGPVFLWMLRPHLGRSME